MHHESKQSRPMTTELADAELDALSGGGGGVPGGPRIGQISASGVPGIRVEKVSASGVPGISIGDREFNPQPGLPPEEMFKKY